MWPAIAAVGSLVGTALAVRESRKNREFQERMSSTAHQREVADLKAAGLNPLLSAQGGPGSSTPSGNVADVDVGKAVSSALMVKQMQAQIALTKAQAEREYNSAALLATQNEEARGVLGMAAGESRLRQRISELDAKQREALLPSVVDKARAEIDSLQSGARASKARAMLDELAKTGATNVAELEALLGKGSPSLRLLFELLRARR